MDAQNKVEGLNLDDLGSLGVTMRVDERIVIGGIIEIVLKRIEGSRVGLAIRAPRALQILRGALLKSRSRADSVSSGDTRSKSSSSAKS